MNWEPRQPAEPVDRSNTAGFGPLSGRRVLEFGHVAAGPFAGSLLADLGADVVKVEPPGGDTMRQWPPLIDRDGDRYSGNFAALNRNKRSVVADLHDAASRDEVRALCDRADVLVENNRPGVMARLGLGFETLRSTNPRLVYCSISGYGQSGPYADRAAFDVAIQAVSGVMSVTGEADGRPVKCGVPVGDFVAGLYAVVCVLAALERRRDTDDGAFIDCAMVSTLLGVAALQTSEYFGTGRPPARFGSAHPRNAPYQAFPGSDGRFVMAAGNDRMWRDLCRAIGRSKLPDDPRFASQESRAANQRELADLLSAVFVTRPAAYWIDSLSRLGIATAAINTYAEALTDRQVQHLGLVTEVTLPNGAVQPTTRFPVAMTGLQFAIHRPPPKLGEHTAEVLSDWDVGVRPHARAGRRCRSTHPATDPTPSSRVASDARRRELTKAGNDSTADTDLERRLKTIKTDRRGRVQMAEGAWPPAGTLITPTDDFFVVHHYDTIDPLPGDHVIDIVDLDGRRTTIDLDGIRELPVTEVTALAECAGMSRKYLPIPAPGAQLGHGVIAAGVWKGTPLRHLVNADDHRWVTAIVSGADTGTAQPENVTGRYEKGLPRRKALDPDTIVAWDLNGAPLSHHHGAPLRLVVPGWYGTWWVKWINRITMTTRKYRGFWQGTRYVYRGDSFAEPEMVTTVQPRALIVSPGDGDHVFPALLEVELLAWDGAAGIATVEVTSDHGRTWSLAERTDAGERWTWSRWRAQLDWPAAAESASISARATSRHGESQDWTSVPNELGYANNGIHTIQLRTRV